MSLGRVLVEEFQPEVLKWLRERVDLVVVNPWVEPQRWDIEAARVDGANEIVIFFRIIMPSITGTLVTVSGDGALNGTYSGWCADIDHTIAENTNYTANVFSSYETLPAGLIENANNLDLVNWIINQDFVGTPAGGTLGNYTYGDVQRAIWEFIEDNPAATTNGLGLWDQQRVNQIKAAASANGEGFTPTCGDFVAVILQPVDSSQLITIAQVTFASLGIDCANSNVATAVLNGVEFPAEAQILWSVNKINETASLDDDQKPDWPTTVSADTTFTYQDPQGYTCSTDPAAYTNGYYQYNESNTAVLTYQTGSDTATASTLVKCYAPVVSKTAAGAYDERHEWDVEKSVTPLTQDVFAGSTGLFDWTVTVTESVYDRLVPWFTSPPFFQMPAIARLPSA